MASPPAVNSQITDSVTQANVKVLGDSPAMALSNLYQATAQALSNAAHNATTSQQQTNHYAKAAAAAAAKTYGADTYRGLINSGSRSSGDTTAALNRNRVATLGVDNILARLNSQRQQQQEQARRRRRVVLC